MYFCIFLFILSFSNRVNCDLIDVFPSSALQLPEIPGPGTLIPDITNITDSISPTAFFFDQNTNFRKAVADLKASLLEIENATDFLATVQALRNDSELNPRILTRAVLGAIVNRNDCADFRIPTLLEAEPDSVLTLDVVSQLQLQLGLPFSQRQCVRVNEFSGADNLVENALWYFRQDPLVNSHHWFWHLYYPMDNPAPRDRRGELFYAMHHSILARYHAERLSNFLPPISPYSVEKNGIIPEGYQAHLTETNARRNWADRPPFRAISDTVETSFVNLTIEETLLWRTRILNSINAGGLLLPNGSTLSIRNFDGIDAVANTVEASIFNVNPSYYGKFGYHNAGHIFIGNVLNPHDPTSAHPPGVMSDTATAMRDVLFYRWHSQVDGMFQKHKETLTPYQPTGGELQLVAPGLRVDSIQVRTKAQAMQRPANVLSTFWSSTTYNLTNGLDFERNQSRGQGPVQVCVKHLNHADFVYNIKVTNANFPTKATVRIFLAPRYSSLGLRYTMREQHNLFFELDTFSVDLVTGANQITRQSSGSTLTIKARQALDELNEDQLGQLRSSVYCGCGWPHYMLLPKGRPLLGMTFDLFVMVTQDGVGSTIPSISSPPPVSTVNRCQESYLYCGSFQNTFPDPKPMGYPFDRLPYTVTDYLVSLPVPFLPPIQLLPYTRMVRDLDEYTKVVPNMASTQIQIIHVDNPVV